MSGRAFVTGSNGFLGANLCRRLLKDGWEVHALVRKDSDHSFLPDGVQIHHGSVTDRDSLSTTMAEGLDVVFHLAGVTSQWSRDFPRQREVNIQGTANTIDVAHEKEAKRFVHLSSIMAFGLHDGIINEETSSNAEGVGNNYCHSKWKAENLAMHAHESGMDVVIVNPSHIIGPYDRNNHIQLFKAILKDELPGVPPGSGMFCHVDDVVTSIIRAFEKGKSGEKYLIGGHYLTFRELSEEIMRQLAKKKSLVTFPKAMFQALLPFYTLASRISGKEPLLTPGKIFISCSHIQCDDSKAREAFGLEYKSKEEMVADTLAWLLSTRE